MQEFNKRLKELRNNKNIIQKDIAEALSISVRAYQHYETGTRYPDFFDVSIDWLVGRSENLQSHKI